MPTITLISRMAAPVEKCFDLSRNIDVHLQSMENFQEQAIEGTQTGLIGLNETVTWTARHFWVRFNMTVRITKIEKPYYFVDEMIKGPFQKLRHEHHFRTAESYTEMKDVFEFKAPYGVFGRIAEKLFLNSYMRNLLTTRNAILKQILEEDGHQKEKQEKFPV